MRPQRPLPQRADGQPDSSSTAPTQTTVAAVRSPGKPRGRVAAALATMPVPITAANQLGLSSGRVAVGGREWADEERIVAPT